MKRDCIHGQLARSCEICEKDAEIARMRPVFHAAMHWYVCWTTAPIGVDKHARLTAAIDALDKACARIAALPLPGVVASTPDEYERRRTAYIIQTAVNEVLSEAAIQVFVVRQESEQDDADDKGTSGWLQDAEQRIRDLLL